VAARVVICLIALALAFNVRAQPVDTGERDDNLLGRFGAVGPFAVPPSELPTQDLIPQSVLDTHNLQSADLSCRVGAGGRLRACRVQWESVVGIGLCEAAVKTAEQVRLKDAFPDGRPLTGMNVWVTMMFDIVGPSPHRIIPNLRGLRSAPFTEVIHPFDDREVQKGPSCPIGA